MLKQKVVYPSLRSVLSVYYTQEIPVVFLGEEEYQNRVHTKYHNLIALHWVVVFYAAPNPFLLSKICLN